MRHPDPIVAVASAFSVGIVILVLASCSASRAPTASPAFTIIADDHGFTAPDSVPAGLRHVVYVNRGKEIHESMFVRLPDGMDAKAYVAAVKGGALFPKGAQDYNGPGLLSPGETTEQWLRLDPGNYILISWNNDDATARDPHPFAVTEAGRHDDTPPNEDVVLELRDFRFHLSAPLRAGMRTIRVVNAGPSMHEADIYRLHEGKTVNDVIAWRSVDDRGKPVPADALGGILDSHDIRREVWIRRNFPAGHYVLQCEMPMSTDVKTGSHFANHTDAGMMLSFEIAK